MCVFLCGTFYSYNYYILILVTRRTFSVVFNYETSSTMSIKVTGESGNNYVSVNVEITSSVTWCSMH